MIDFLVNLICLSILAVTFLGAGMAIELLLHQPSTLQGIVLLIQDHRHRPMVIVMGGVIGGLLWTGIIRSAERLHVAWLRIMLCRRAALTWEDGSPGPGLRDR